MQAEEIIALDVGSKRIGVARANSIARIPEALETVLVDGEEISRIEQIADGLSAKKIVIGLPRNQSGDETLQSQYVRDFAQKLERFDIIWQDESLTSVSAEASLQQSGKNYSKADVDALAAAQILMDYLNQS
jgi:putative Holliday junction resolvase